MTSVASRLVMNVDVYHADQATSARGYREVRRELARMK